MFVMKDARSGITERGFKCGLNIIHEKSVFNVFFVSAYLCGIIFF